MATKWLCGLLPRRSSPSSSSLAPKEKLRWSFLKCYRRKKDRPSRIRRDEFSGHYEAAMPADQGAAAVFRLDSGTANPAAADVSGRGARIREESAAVNIQILKLKDVRPGTDSGELTQEGIKSPDDSCPALTNGPESSSANGVMSEPQSCNASNGGEEKVSTDAIDVESMISNTGLESGVNQHVSNASIQLESEDGDGIVPKDSDSGIVVDGFFQENSEQNVDIFGNQQDEEAALTTLSEGKLEGQNAGVEVVKRSFYYLIRIPRYDDENLREQIKLVELQVEERTKIRDAIVAKVPVQTDIAKEFASKVVASLTEERGARELFKSKRQEIDSVQFLINKVKNAQSVEDIQAKIRSMEHMIEHEILSLKEEKRLIRDIKRLKQFREQLSSNMGKQDEVQQALDQKDQIERRLRVLRKELDLLREKVIKAEEVSQTAKKKSNVENVKLKELISQFRDADNIHQEAYAQLWSLKKQQYEKNNHFVGYKDAFEAAQKLALSGDKEQLQRFCIDQVEKVMELWNNDDFRQDYIRCNTRSTLRRLSTLDGRSLGPDEEPPVIPDVVVNKRVTKDNSVSLTNVPEQEKQEVPAKADKLDGTKVVERSKQPSKTKKPAKLASSSSTKPDTISGEDERKQEVREEQEEEPIMNKAEEELARKAEELRREEEAVKLKQQRKLEERAKAKEAIERKKRIAEKAQARAAIRAQKEAEKKEKEREKRARKKEKKANGIENRNGDEVGLGTPTPSSEIPGNGAQPESEKLATIMKRQQKAQQFTKQGRARSVAVPPPFRNRGKRNRGKRRMKPWMWVALVVAIVLASSLCWPSCLQ